MDPMMEAVVIALVPGIVEIAKRTGMPTRYAGLAAIIAAIALIALSDLAASSSTISSAAGWLVQGVISGLAAAGLYSQSSRLGNRTSR